MEKKGKRERNVNFSRNETETLVAIIEMYKNIIENKKGGAVTWNEKEKAWHAIEVAFNNSGDWVYRNAKNLKLKYEAMKRDIRKKSSVIRAEHCRPGGRSREPTALTPIEQKVKQMILLSVEGEESIYDSDPLNIAAGDVPMPLVVLGDSSFQTENLEGAKTYDTDDNSKEMNVKPEYAPEERHLDEVDGPAPSTSRQENGDATEPLPKKWNQWKPSPDQHKNPAFCKLKEKRSDRLHESKLEVIELQKKVIEEEYQEKILKQLAMENEMRYKKQLFELEKEERLLKIEILKCELENKKKLT